MTYEETAEELKRRILALIPDHPEILTIHSAWDLFKVPGFDCGDLQPSMYQAGWALASARRQWRAQNDAGAPPRGGAPAS